MWTPRIRELKGGGYVTLAFTGPIARGLSLVAIVVGGLMFAFGEGDSKRMLAGILFGVGMAISATHFMFWLFG
jgi:type IV secretory pathway VirB2 component (pilin)